MRRSIYIASILVLGSLGISLGQWQVQPQVQTQQGPVYPSKPYSFRQAPPNYDPFQFNWYTGRWDYVPIPYQISPSQEQTPGPFQFNWNTGGWNQAPVTPPAHVNTNTNSASVSLGEEHSPTDSGLWAKPTTQPENSPPPKVTQFQGRIVAIRAVNLAGDPQPHLLLRMHNAAGTTATVDVGTRLDIPELHVGSDKDAEVSVTGKLGDIDGSPVLFADQIKFGSISITITRPGQRPQPK